MDNTGIASLDADSKEPALPEDKARAERMAREEAEQKQSDNIVLAVVVAIGLVLAISVAYFMVATTWFTQPKDSGAFGDTFGALNTIFSGLAFSALILALFMQGRELSLQRLELKETQRIMAAQQKEMSDQAEIMHLQQFEATFFQLLNQQRQILQSITTTTDTAEQRGGLPAYLSPTPPSSYAGLEAARVLASKLMALGSDLKSAVPRRSVEHVDLVGQFDRLFKVNEESFGHYFRHLYHIVKFINNSNIEEKNFYTGIVRAQLSSAEISLLFFNGLSTAGNKFKPLIEKYCLLQHIRWEIRIRSLATLYEAEAFLSPKRETHDVRRLLQFVGRLDRQRIQHACDIWKLDNPFHWKKGDESNSAAGAKPPPSEREAQV